MSKFNQLDRDFSNLLNFFYFILFYFSKTKQLISVVGSTDMKDEIWYCVVIQDQASLKSGEDLKAFPKSVWCNRVDSNDVPKR